MSTATKIVIGMVGAAIGMCTWPAVAQQAATGAAASDAATTEQEGLVEIVVTAQRREEVSQRAPITITAIGSEALAQQHAATFTDLSSVLPDTEVTVNGGARITIAVRGVRNNDFSPGAESPVAVNLDGSYIPRMSGLQGEFYDLARVESLPGPQGTLYGRNAAAGVINLITNRPVQDAQSSVEVETGEYSLLRTAAMLNEPLTDTLAIRTAFQRYQHTGYNEAGGDDADQTSGRFSALWHAGRSQLYFMTDYTSIGGKGTMDNDVSLPAYDSRSIYGPAASNNARVDIRQLGAMLEYDLDMDFATLTAIASARNSDESSFTLGGGQLSYFQFKSRAKIGEIRLTSNVAKPVSWVVGAFGYDEKQPSYGVVNANAADPFGAGGTCDASNATPTIPPCGNYLPQLNLQTKSYAFFGQTTWTPIDPLHLTAGIRYSHDEKIYNGAYLCQIGGTGQFFDLSTCQNPPLPIDAGSPAHWQSVDYKGGIAYDLTRDSVLYFNVATGYRAGGSFISPFYPTYNPEKVKDYEIGWKNQFFQHRLIVNVNIYDQKYSDYIYTYGVIGDIVPIPGVFVPFSATQADNLGSVKLHGADLTVAYLATPDDLLNLGGEYLESEVGSGSLRCNAAFPTDNGPCAPAGGYVNPQGKPLPDTPRWRTTAAYEHTLRLTGGSTLVPRVQYHYEAGRLMNFQNVPGTYQGGYGEFDASLTFNSSDKSWDLAAWARNLENKAVYQTAGAVTTDLAAYPSKANATYAPPRTLGITLRKRF